MSYLIRKKEDVKETVIESAHGGQGQIKVRQVLGDLPGSGLIGFPDDFETPVNFVHIVTLPPNTSIGYHEHPNNEEFYYVISGHGRMHADGNDLDMPEGSIFLIKKGSGHSFHNDSEEVLVAMVMEVEYGDSKL